MSWGETWVCSSGLSRLVSQSLESFRLVMFSRGLPRTGNVELFKLFTLLECYCVYFFTLLLVVHAECLRAAATFGAIWHDNLIRLEFSIGHARNCSEVANLCCRRQITEILCCFNCYFMKCLAVLYACGFAQSCCHALDFFTRTCTCTYTTQRP